jgi:hypothetical protein
MKKLLLVLAVAGFVSACNNEKKDEPKTDSTATQQAPTQDTNAMKAPDTSAKMMSADTTKK